MKNIYHRYLNIPVSYIPIYPVLSDTISIQHLILKRLEVSNEVHNWLDTVGLEFVKGSIFFLPPFSVVKPHIDTPEPNNIVRINWVYSNCNNSMEWSELTEGSEYKIDIAKTGRQYVSVDPDKCFKVFESKMDKPSLVNVGKLHGSHNGHTESWYFGIMVKEKGKNNLLEWDRALEILKDYITE